MAGVGGGFDGFCVGVANFFAKSVKYYFTLRPEPTAIKGFAQSETYIKPNSIKQSILYFQIFGSKNFVSLKMWL